MFLNVVLLQCLFQTLIPTQINLEKVREGYWWTALFKDDEHQISLDSIDTTRHMHEFPQVYDLASRIWVRKTS